MYRQAQNVRKGRDGKTKSAEVNIVVSVLSSKLPWARPTDWHQVSAGRAENALVNLHAQLSLFAAIADALPEQEDDAFIDKVNHETSRNETRHRHGLTSKRDKTHYYCLNKQNQQYRTPKPQISP